MIKKLISVCSGRGQPTADTVIIYGNILLNIFCFLLLYGQFGFTLNPDELRLVMDGNGQIVGASSCHGILTVPW